MDLPWQLRPLELVLSIPGFGLEKTIVFIWSPDPSNFQQFCTENSDTPGAGWEHCSGALFPSLSYFLEVKWLIIKPGTTALIFGPSQLWPRVANIELQAEAAVDAAKLLAAQRWAQQQERIHSGKIRIFLNDKTIDATTWIILFNWFII